MSIPDSFPHLSRRDRNARVSPRLTSEYVERRYLSRSQKCFGRNDGLECFCSSDPHLRRIYEAFHLQLVRTPVIHIGADVLRVGKNLMDRGSRPGISHVRQNTLTIEIKGKVFF